MDVRNFRSNWICFQRMTCRRAGIGILRGEEQEIQIVRWIVVEKSIDADGDGELLFWKAVVVAEMHSGTCSDCRTGFSDRNSRADGNWTFRRTSNVSLVRSPCGSRSCHFHVPPDLVPVPADGRLRSGFFVWELLVGDCLHRPIVCFVQSVRIGSAGESVVAHSSASKSGLSLIPMIVTATGISADCREDHSGIRTHWIVIQLWNGDRIGQRICSVIPGNEKRKNRLQPACGILFRHVHADFHLFHGPDRHFSHLWHHVRMWQKSDHCGMRQIGYSIAFLLIVIGTCGIHFARVRHPPPRFGA